MPATFIVCFDEINYPAASERGMEMNDNIFVPLTYPSPQGEGTIGKPTASGWGI